MKILLYLLFSFQICFGYYNSTFTSYSDPLISNVKTIIDTDIDNDGDTDLFVINQNGNIIWLENDGKRNFSSHSIYYTRNNNSYITTTDYNNDSFIDLAITNSDSNYIYLFINDKYGNFTASRIGHIIPNIQAIFFADFNNDQKQDILVNYTTSDKIVTLINQDSIYQEIVVIDSTWETTYGLAAPCDMNGDGYSDIVHPFIETNVYINQGNHLYDKKRISGYSFITSGNSRTLDVNHDGYEDVLFFYKSGIIFCYGNNEVDSIIVGKVSSQFDENYEQTSICDMNQDGYNDYIAYGSSYSNDKNRMIYGIDYMMSNNKGRYDYNGFPIPHPTTYAHAVLFKEDSTSFIITGNDSLHFHTLVVVDHVIPNDFTEVVAENGISSISLIKLYFRDTIFDISVDKEPSHGSFSISNNKLIYTPDPDFTGIDTFQYHVEYPVFNSRVVTVYLNVLPFPDSLSQTDYHIITTQKFFNEAQEYSDYRENSSDDLITSPSVATAEQIYSTYATSPLTINSRRMAICTYIRLLQSKSQNLKYIFFIGNPDSSATTEFIPSGLQQQYGDPTGDYWYSAYSESESYNAYSRLSYGRITADSNIEVSNYLDKVQKYEDDVNNGMQWKNNILFLLDDDTNVISDGFDPVNHIEDYNKYIAPQIPNYLNKNFIHMDEYSKRMVNGYIDIIGDEIDFIDALNSGSFVTFSAVHGFITGLGMEQIFTSNDLSKVSNNNKPSIMLLGGCDLGNYTSATRCLTEDLVLVENGGAIISLGATYSVFSSTALKFYSAWFAELYKVTTGSKTTLGEIDRIVRNSYVSQIVDDNYPFFGDPGITYKRNIVINNKICLPDTISGGCTTAVNTSTFTSDNINSTFISINDTSYVASVNSYDSVYSYDKEGNSIYFDFSTSGSFTLDTLKDSKGTLRMMFFGDDNDYVYYKKDITIKAWSPGDTFTKTLKEDNRISINFGANPIPSNNPIRVIYSLPKEYRGKTIKAAVYSQYGKKEFKLNPDQTKGVFIFDNIKLFLRGSVGRICIVVDSEVVKSQDIYCE